MPPAAALRPLPSAADPPAPHGIRAQISHLIPRHSYFRARVTIHQIDSVPFVSGQFAVRWKFKHVHSPPRGLLGIVKTRSKNGDKRIPGNLPDDVSLDATSTASSLPSDSASTTRLPSISDSNSSISSNATPSTPTSPLSYTITSSADTTTPARGVTLYSPLKDHSVRWNQHLSTVVRLDVDRDNGYIFPCPFKLVVMQRPSEGDYIYSSGHTNVPEEHRLGAIHLNLSEYVGHGPVERRYLLRESRTNATLKLTIELDFISGQTSYIPPPLPKGEILNGLSGYLESEFSRSTLPPKTSSRSNSISSSQDTLHHHPPPNNIELYGPYLNQEELELDLFGTRRLERKKSKSSFVMILNRSRSKLGLTPTDKVRGANESEEGESDYEFMDDQFTNHHHPNSPTAITIVPPSDTLPHDAATTPTPAFPQLPARKPTFFDVERLPMAYGTKTTETLIEAIFNPVRIEEERCESPFTVYVPPATPVPPALLSADREEEGTYTPRTSHPPPRPTHSPHRIKRKPVPNIEVASVYSTCSTTSTSNSSSSTNSTSSSGRSSGAMPGSVRRGGSVGSAQSPTGVNVSVGVAGASGSGGGKVKEWWKKTVGGSRPATPLNT